MRRPGGSSYWRSRLSGKRIPKTAAAPTPQAEDRPDLTRSAAEYAAGRRKRQRVSIRQEEEEEEVEEEEGYAASAAMVRGRSRGVAQHDAPAVAEEAEGETGDEDEVGSGWELGGIWVATGCGLSRWGGGVLVGSGWDLGTS